MRYEASLRSLTCSLLGGHVIGMEKTGVGVTSEYRHWNLLHTSLNVSSNWHTSRSDTSAQSGNFMIQQTQLPTSHITMEYRSKYFIKPAHTHGRGCCSDNEPPDEAARQDCCDASLMMWFILFTASIHTCSYWQCNEQN